MRTGLAGLRAATRSSVDAWNSFFFTPQPATPIALYRILYGLLIIANLVLLRGDWLTWFGAKGLVRAETLQKLSPNSRADLIWNFVHDDFWVQAFFWVFLVFAVFLTVGFLSRLSSVVTFVFLGVLIQRNPYITNGGDYLLRFTGFFLMFAPTGAALSLDRVCRIWAGREGPESQPCWPWAQRMIQIQTSILYLSAFCWKTLGSEWRDGTAVYYVSRLIQFQRFPMPNLENGVMLRLVTWSTVFIEFALGAVVWVRKFRYWVLLLGVCMHLSIEYSMNIPLFEWISMAGFVLFLDSADLSRAWACVRRHLAGCFGQSAEVLFDGESAASMRLTNLLRALDVFRCLRFIDWRSASGRASWPGLSESHEHTSLLIATEGSLREGFSGVLAISRLIPLLWWLVPFSYVPRLRGESLPALKTAK